MICELCERDVEHLTVHHLIPRQQTKRKKLDSGATTNICYACHRQIHNLFNNRQLAQELNTLEKLKQDPAMAKFLSWVKKQDPSKRVKIYSQRS